MPLGKALIVDDSHTSAAILGKMLTRQGLVWDQVDSGEDCLAYLVSATPDVIFMDHMMPGMDGFQAVKAIVQQPELEHIPIVMHTSRQGELYYGQARALGAVGVLQKPATQQDLLGVLARVRAVIPDEKIAATATDDLPAATSTISTPDDVAGQSGGAAADAAKASSWRVAASQTRARSGQMPLRLHRALIVDDSRTSAAVLARMLARHALGCDRVGSGEECLNYLAAANPDIIFMDHMMPGMDGFEAVRAIKQQTKLRAIPIVMYTSQSGDMYFGQARALGAVGVLKKPATEKDLTEILQRIKSEHRVDSTVESSPQSRPQLTVVDADAAGPVAVVGQERRAPASKPLPGSQDSLQQPSAEPARASMPAWPRLRETAYVALLVMSVGWGWHLWQQQSGIDQRLLVASLAALGNQAQEYSYGDMPFDQSRYRQLREVVRILSLAQVPADIELRAHVGEFCRVYADASSSVLPDSQLPIERCDLIGYEPAEARQLALGQSSEFRQFVQQVNQHDNGIRVSIVPIGVFEPRLPYPPDTQITMAADWNHIAARNNRVEMRVSVPSAAN
jgi:CheY-like chemotaxis protein